MMRLNHDSPRSFCSVRCNPALRDNILTLLTWPLASPVTIFGRLIGVVALGTPLSGCRLTAADVDLNSSVNTVDVIAVQRFFLNQTSGLANVGHYQFTPASRTYPGLVTNQTVQNFDALVFGDVATTFVHRPEGSPAQDAADAVLRSQR